MTKHQQLFIDGQWVDGNGTFAVRNPFDGSQVADVEIASAEQAQRAVDCAQNAMRTPIPPAQRANILRTTSDLLTSRSEEISRTIQVEAGKPITAARAEVNRAVQTFRIASEEARRLPGETIPFDALPDGRQPLGFTVAVPKGVVAAITPFNFPLNLVSHKVAPALAAGCSVVLKPSERTPLTAGLLTRVLSEAGLPPGWLNLVTGRPVQHWLAEAIDEGATVAAGGHLARIRRARRGGRTRAPSHHLTREYPRSTRPDTASTPQSSPPASIARRRLSPSGRTIRTLP